MSPLALTVLDRVITLGLVPLLGVLVNYLLSKYTVEGSKWRKGAAAWLSTTPGLAQGAIAIEAPGISKDEKIKRTVNALDAMIASTTVALKAAYVPDEPPTRRDIPSVRPVPPVDGPPEPVKPGEFR